jgi:hypothetical protein
MKAGKQGFSDKAEDRKGQQGRANQAEGDAKNGTVGQERGKAGEADTTYHLYQG